MRCAVLGAGPAGLLAGRALADAGFRVSVIDPRLGETVSTRPQSPHVHVLPSPIWPRLEALAPGLGDALVALGVPFGSIGSSTLDGDLDGDTLPWPSRESLDQALSMVCLPALGDSSAARMLGCAWGLNSCRVSTSDGEVIEADVVIDATGLQRASFGSVATHIGTPLPVNEGPAGGGYVSMSLSGLSLPPGRIGHRTWDTASGHRAILIREQGERGRITVQASARAPLPRTYDGVMAVLGDFQDRRLFDIVSCAKAETVHTWAGQRPSLAALEDVEGLPGCWLLLGDSLLCTPPHFGQGLAQVVVQVEMLREHLRHRMSVEGLRQALCRAAHRQWLRATVMEALGHG